MSSAIGFEERVTIRMKEADLEEIQPIVDAMPEKYFNESHFIRVAVIRLIREEKSSLAKIGLDKKRRLKK